MEEEKKLGPRSQRGEGRLLLDMFGSRRAYQPIGCLEGEEIMMGEQGADLWLILLTQALSPQDLFYRINGMTIALPALRERKEDIPLLVEHLIRKLARDFKLSPSGLSDEALQLLLQHSWPRNVRELEGVIRNAMLFAKERVMTPPFLIFSQEAVSNSAPLLPETGSSARHEKESDEERSRLLEALRKHQLNKKLVAEQFGVSLKTIYMWMDRHGLPKKKSQLEKFFNSAH